MEQSALRQGLKDALAHTPLYPLVKEVYRRTINRQYLHSRNQLLDFYGALVRKAGLVFDVGANRGDFADVFLRLGARVVAVEPHPVCIKELHSLYGHDSKFKVAACALGAAPGEAQLYLGEQGMDNVSTLSEDYRQMAKQLPGLAPAGWNQSITVKVDTLDALIATHGMPDFCKIDVEGFELDVLRGLHRPLPMMQFEYQPWSVEKAVACIECLEGQTAYRYNITMAANRDAKVALRPAWVDATGMIALLRERVAAEGSAGDVFVSTSH